MPDRANILHQSQANPFVAKFGKVPVYFAGREDVISEITLMFEEDEETACCLLVGARGTGKTALLTYQQMYLLYQECCKIFSYKHKLPLVI